MLGKTTCCIDFRKTFIQLFCGMITFIIKCDIFYSSTYPSDILRKISDVFLFVLPFLFFSITHEKVLFTFTLSSSIVERILYVCRDILWILLLLESSLWSFDFIDNVLFSFNTIYVFSFRMLHLFLLNNEVEIVVITNN